MKLGMREGRVRRIRKDGTVSPVRASVEAQLEYLGFPVPVGGTDSSVKVLLGDPYRDDEVVVVAWSSGLGGNYILRRDQDEALKLIRAAREAIAEGTLTLANAIRYAEAFPEHVQPEALAEERGLKVTVGTSLGGYYLYERHQLCLQLPEAWDVLPKGDAALTRSVKKMGAYWEVWEKRGKYARQFGIAAPKTSIERARGQLGGEEGSQLRERSKDDGQAKREERITREFEAAVRAEFPRMPDEDVRAVVERARRDGVGRAQWVYITTREAREANLREAARLAVRAHARHSYTCYDELLADGGEREDARQLIGGEVRQKLEEWRRGPTG